MASIEPTASPPRRPPFQFSLRTLLLLFVLLGSSLGVFGAWGIMVFGLVVGLAIGLNRVRRMEPLMTLVVIVLCLIGLGLLMPQIEAAQESGRRPQCANNLKQIAVALQLYHQANGCFPPAYIADKDGKPMHSWRVLILPYMDQGALYKMYKFSEPWDGPNNKKLACPIAVYACPSNGRSWLSSPFETSYLAFVGPKGEWPSEKATTNAADALPSDVIMVVEVVDSGISWMAPRDLSIDALEASETLSPGLAPSSRHGPQSGFFVTYEHCNGVCAAMADGSVRFLPPGSLWTKAPQIRPNWPNIAALAVWLLSVGTLLTQVVRSRKAWPPCPHA